MINKKLLFTYIIISPLLQIYISNTPIIVWQVIVIFSMLAIGISLLILLFNDTINAKENIFKYKLFKPLIKNKENKILNIPWIKNRQTEKTINELGLSSKGANKKFIISETVNTELIKLRQTWDFQVSKIIQKKNKEILKLKKKLEK